MGHIRKEELHESLINELEDLGNIDLSGKQDKTDESLLTESKDLVGAINELFQSANNGKELIASAIGEPLNAEDTFSAMSNDINGLLSTFKTNMMNNGVTVESGDKFKALIDKIATMVEEGNGKGIQFASGQVTRNLTKSLKYINTSFAVFEIENLGFIPEICYLRGEDGSDGWDDFISIYHKSDDTFIISHPSEDILNRISSSNLTNSEISENMVTMPLYSTCAITATYYAIGVGEEDTTLRDSLASILESNGVDVSDEDDMAGLIGKVDEELDRINAETSIMKTGKAIVSNLYSSTETFTVNINPNFVPKEIICTITSFRFNYTSGSYSTILTPTVMYSKYNNTSSNYVTLSPRSGNYGADVYISSISQSNFVVTITRFTGYSIPSMSIEWIAIS